MRCKSSRRTFENAAHGIELENSGARQLDDDKPTRNRLCKPPRLQSRQCLADGRSADAELRANLVFAESIAGGKRAGPNAVDEHLVDLEGARSGAPPA